MTVNSSILDMKVKGNYEVAIIEINKLEST